MCDYRRAVVVISIMYMIYYLILCILWFTGATTAIIFGAATRDNEDVDSDAALVAGGAAYIVGVTCSICVLHYGTVPAC